MKDAQILLWFGLTFMAMGVGMLTNPNFIKNLAKEFLSSTANVFYGGLACMAIGFPLVALHNDWTWGSSLIITLLGWLSLFKGLALLMFPLQATKMYKGALTKENIFFVNFFVLVMGGLLLLLGYLA